MTTKASQGDLALMKRFMGHGNQLADHIKDDVFVSKRSNRERYAKMNAHLCELVNADHLIGRVIKRVKDNVNKEVKLYCITDETEATLILQERMKELVAELRQTNAGSIIRTNGKLVIKSNGSNAFALLGLSQKHNISMNTKEIRRKNGVMFDKHDIGNNMGLSKDIGHNHVRIMSEINQIHCVVCNKLMNGKSISRECRKLRTCEECLEL